jgi:hypothetical protein
MQAEALGLKLQRVVQVLNPDHAVDDFRHSRLVNPVSPSGVHSMPAPGATGNKRLNQLLHFEKI